MAQVISNFVKQIWRQPGRAQIFVDKLCIDFVGIAVAGIISNEMRWDDSRLGGGSFPRFCDEGEFLGICWLKIKKGEDVGSSLGTPCTIAFGREPLLWTPTNFALSSVRLSPVKVSLRSWDWKSWCLSNLMKSFSCPASTRWTVPFQPKTAHPSGLVPSH